jgi:hypothetical protein
LVIGIPNIGSVPYENLWNNGRCFFQSMTQYWEIISMTISHAQLLKEIEAGHDGPPIPPAKLAYFQERLRGRIFDFILGIFLDEQKNGLTQAKLARRIGRTADVVNRWLGAPSNLTVDTISDLLVGIAAEEPSLSRSSLLGRAPVNSSHLDDVPSIADAEVSKQRADTAVSKQRADTPSAMNSISAPIQKRGATIQASDTWK